ncbi:MAG: sulfurtransferase TusA family protein [Fibrobacter sp.]|nr:sulfurtransferase TusA family protein [Fibrobacter sp.]
MNPSNMDSPIRRWLSANQNSDGFELSLQRLLAFACADWILRGAGLSATPEEALSRVVAASLTQFPLGEWMESPREFLDEIADFCEKTKVLPLPDSLKSEIPKILDLRGVVCPRNAARSRLVMAGLPAGFRLTIYLDDGSPIENVPGSLVADGNVVENRQKKGNFWALTVVKGETRV